MPLNESLSSSLVPKHYVEERHMIDGTVNHVHRLALGPVQFRMFRRGVYFDMPRVRFKASIVRGVQVFLSMGAEYKLTVEFRGGPKPWQSRKSN